MGVEARAVLWDQKYRDRVAVSASCETPEYPGERTKGSNEVSVPWVDRLRRRVYMPVQLTVEDDLMEDHALVHVTSTGGKPNITYKVPIDNKDHTWKAAGDICFELQARAWRPEDQQNKQVSFRY